MSLGTSDDWRYCIYGTQGTIQTGGNRSLADPNWQLAPHVNGKKGQPRGVEPGVGGDHMENWLECLRSRERPRADIQFGHQHAVASIMSAERYSAGVARSTTRRPGRSNRVDGGA